ncbi:MAG TPA: hypothetical protein VKA21_10000 [Candidatus Binatia bacterium]|nr:hypothetical protein [Candidatus Binatia bacterium]
MIAAEHAVRLDGASGAVDWRNFLTVGPHGEEFGAVNDGALDAAGNLFVAGVDDAAGFMVAKLDGVTGGGYPIAGKRLRVRDGDGAPSRRSINFLSQDPNVAGDPSGALADPTTAGALLELINPTTTETATMQLPAAGWTALGMPPGSLGYRYVDGHGALGPCTKVLMTPRKLLASCKGAGIPFSLDEPTQGSLAVRLTSGPDGLRRCALFGGSVRRDQGAGGGSGGLYFAKDSARPDECP